PACRWTPPSCRRSRSPRRRRRRDPRRRRLADPGRRSAGRGRRNPPAGPGCRPSRRWPWHLLPARSCAEPLAILRYFWALRRGVYAAERRRHRVVEAFMLIQTDVGRAEVVAKQLAELAGVLSAEYVTGPYDVVVRIGADTISDLQDTVVPSVQQVAGITRT